MAARLIIEPTLCNDAENIQSVYIGHIGEMHYVSTCPVSPLENSTDIEHEKSGEHIHLSPKNKQQKQQEPNIIAGYITKETYELFFNP